MPRYKLTLEYDGTPFCGWQKQQDGALTVQEVLETAAAKFLGTGEPVEIWCAGRTDAGVHARGQVAHVDFPKRDLFNVRQGLNNFTLPHPIVVVSAEEVGDDFHARFDAKKRHYLYRITNRSSRLAIDRDRSWQVHGEFDLEAMKQAAGYLIGHHDFTSFRSVQCQSKSPVKTLDTLEILQRQNRPQELMIRCSAKSFLHHQVRNMVGTLAFVGRGKWKPERVAEALEAKDRRAGGPMAPAHGLYLMAVDY